MTIQTLEKEPTYKTEATPFVVQQADLDLFDSLGDLDYSISKAALQLQQAPSSCDQFKSEDSICITDFTPRQHNSRQPRRSSTCSNSSRRSSASSVCSKSFHWDDDQSSVASCLSTSRRSSRTSSSSRRRKHVTFNSSVTVRDVPHPTPLDEQDVLQRWYGEKELAEIKLEATVLIQSVKDKSVVIEDETEIRGLHVSRKRERRSRWVMALSCVLDEQERQQNLGITDGETMAKLYKSFTSLATALAIKAGEKDAKAARQEYRVNTSC